MKYKYLVIDVEKHLRSLLNNGIDSINGTTTSISVLAKHGMVLELCLETGEITSYKKKNLPI